MLICWTNNKKKIFQWRYLLRIHNMGQIICRRLHQRNYRSLTFRGRSEKALTAQNHMKRNNIKYQQFRVKAVKTTMEIRVTFMVFPFIKGIKHCKTAYTNVVTNGKCSKKVEHESNFCLMLVKLLLMHECDKQNNCEEG